MERNCFRYVRFCEVVLCVEYFGICSFGDGVSCVVCGVFGLDRGVLGFVVVLYDYFFLECFIMWEVFGGW